MDCSVMQDKVTVYLVRDRRDASGHGVGSASEAEAFDPIDRREDAGLAGLIVVGEADRIGRDPADKVASSVSANGALSVGKGGNLPRPAIYEDGW